MRISDLLSLHPIVFASDVAPLTGARGTAGLGLVPFDAPVLGGAPAASTRVLSDHRIRTACTRADMHFNSFVCIAKCFNDRSMVHFNVKYSKKSSPK